MFPQPRATTFLHAATPTSDIHTHAITTPTLPSPISWTHGMHRVGRVGQVSGWARSPSAACLWTRVTPGQGIGGHSIPLNLCVSLCETPVSAATRHHLPLRGDTDFQHPHLCHHHTSYTLTYSLDAWHSSGWAGWVQSPWRLAQRPGTQTGGGLGPLNPLEPACVPEEDTHIRRNAPPPSSTQPHPHPTATSTRPTAPTTPTSTRPHPSSDTLTHLLTSCNLYAHQRSLASH